jgi:hypothetical protein
VADADQPFIHFISAEAATSAESDACAAPLTTKEAPLATVTMTPVSGAVARAVGAGAGPRRAPPDWWWCQYRSLSNGLPQIVVCAKTSTAPTLAWPRIEHSILSSCTSAPTVRQDLSGDMVEIEPSARFGERALVDFKDFEQLYIHPEQTSRYDRLCRDRR